MKQFRPVVIRMYLVVGMIVSLHAAPVGNPAFPQIIENGFFTNSTSSMSFRLGYEGDFVSDARMEKTNQGHGRVDNYEQWVNSASITFNLLDRIDFYTVLGGSKTEADWRFTDHILDEIFRIELKTDYDFLWGVGARAILYQWGNTCLGFGGRYSSSKGAPKEFRSNGAFLPTDGANLNWHEWQVDLDVSYKIKVFTPYIGVKYLEAKTLLTDFSSSISDSLEGSLEFQTRVPVGLFLGCTISNGHDFMLTLEARLIDEEAVSVFADFRF